MQTIGRRLSILLFTCSMAAILLIMLFVNITINNKFNRYMIDIQNKRHQRIVSYLEDVYNRQGKWTKDSGIELMHEAYMGNYCLTLMDTSKKSIWGMDPNEIKSNLNLMTKNDKGVYNTNTYEIKSSGKVVGYVEVGQYSSVLLSEEDINFKASINKTIIASGLLTLVIIITISIYFSKRLSTPIKEVADISVNLSRGNFEAKSITESNILEIENLRNSINILGEKLKHQDNLRKRLVSDISHEIRTPLNVLQNNLEAMIDGVFPVTMDRLNYLNEEVVRFGKLLNNLNVLKEFEEESIKLNIQPVRLNELLEDIIKDFYVASENKKIKLEFKVEQNEKYLITGDKDKLKQVFINLISNAIKFTEEEGNISVSLYDRGKKIIVKIQDNGIGIKKEDLPFIGERLYRGDMSRHQIEGSGIGLTIVNNILRLHYATLDIKSEEGKGTTFIIHFNREG